MKRESLDQTHPSYDATYWNELEALAEGGKKFHSLIDTFLPRNLMEPEMMYMARKKRAAFHSYTGSIINLYASWLFVAGFEAKPYMRDSEIPIGTVDTFYGNFQENVGGETTLKSFMKDRYRDALKVGKAVWLAELPQKPENTEIDDRQTYDALGLGNATLTRVHPAELLDWEEESSGVLKWCVLKRCWVERSSPAAVRNHVVEQWRIYNTETVTTYELRYEKGKRQSKEISFRGETSHGFKRVPVVQLQLPTEMCIGEQTRDPQLEHFRLDAALSWAISRTCYAMPVFKLSDDATKPTMGSGYALYLGEKESLDWASPPTDSFDTISKARDAKREEIFRICHAMAAGVDNNAETVGRSAESKEIDAAATRIMLNAYGEIVGKAIEETYEMISEARGDEEYEWSVEGFSGYDTATASTLLANVEKAKGLGIPSNTFQREISKKGALALVPELDPRVKDTIRSEIDKYTFPVTGQLLEQQIARENISSETLKPQENAALKVESVVNPRAV